MTIERSIPARSAVPPYRAAERGTLEGNCGTEQRNDSGTPDLKALAEQTLSRIRGGTPSGTQAEQQAKKPFRPPGTGVCPHVTEDWLRDWYSEHPEVVCARCWLASHPTRPPAATPTAPSGARRNSR